MGKLNKGDYVNIKSKDSWHDGGWGYVVGEGGRKNQYVVSMYGMYPASKDTAVFDRDELVKPRKKKAKKVKR